MTSYAWARAESADAPVAVLLPGVNYSVQAPLLYWCATLLAERGWHVQAVDWTVDDDARAHPLPFVEAAVTEAFDESPASLAAAGGREVVRHLRAALGAARRALPACG